jgi:cell division septation protein DedD
VKAQPTNPFGDDQQLSQSAPGPTDSSDKPNQSAMLTEQPTTAVAATTARSGQAEPIQAPAPSAPVIVSGPVSADLPPPAPSSAEMAPALAAGAAPAPVVGPSVGSNAKPRESRQTSARSTAITSADTTAPLAAPSATRSAIPAVRKPVLATRAQPAAIIAADHSQTMTMLNPLATPTKPGGGDRAASAPLPITPQGFPDRLADASAAPAQAAQPAATTEARANATGGSSLWVGVASSYSESDARATLSQLQKQFPGRLGGGSISRDDRGGAGVFYRVRVGPLSLESAAKVCSRLRAAGKNCVLTRG